MRLIGIEPTHAAPEATALSTELQVHDCPTPSILPYFPRKSKRKNKKSGKILIKKGTKKGTYKIKVKVVAAGNSKYESTYKVVTVKIKVNK